MSSAWAATHSTRPLHLMRFVFITGPCQKGSIAKYACYLPNAGSATRDMDTAEGAEREWPLQSARGIPKDETIVDHTPRVCAARRGRGRGRRSGPLHASGPGRIPG